MTDTPVLVFARLDSRRLPGKALTPLGGRPMLARVVERCVRARLAGPVVVATSDRAADDPIADVAGRLGVGVFRGDVDDVAGRALACSDSLGARQFVRISGDSPLIDPVLIDRLVALHRARGAALTTNLHPRSFPPGLSVEVIDTAALHMALAAGGDAYDREHVTPALYRTLPAARIHNVQCDTAVPAGLSLAVDTADDLRFVASLLAALGENAPGAGYAEIIATARSLLAAQAAQ
ncbi:MAG: NTP transferase domain-containing protein [Alphaproteobacteria bacterium]